MWPKCGLGKVVYSSDMDRLQCERDKLESHPDGGVNLTVQTHIATEEKLCN